MAGADTQKRIKALQKKIGQIEKLKEKKELSPEEAEKVNSEKNLLAEMDALGKGQEWPAAQQAPAKEPVAERPKAVQKNVEPVAERPKDAVAQPSGGDEEHDHQQEVLDPAEAEKRIKAAKKKIIQIQKMKERDPSTFNPEEAEKVASEPKLLNEVVELEIGLLHGTEAFNQARNLYKKLDQIKKLKEKKTALTAPEKEKVFKGAALNSELDQILNGARVARERTQAAERAAAPKKEPPAPKKAAKKEASPKAAPASPPSKPVASPVRAPVEYEPEEYYQGGGGAFEQLDDDDEGFVTAKSKAKKSKAKAKSAAPEQEQPQEQDQGEQYTEGGFEDTPATDHVEQPVEDRHERKAEGRQQHSGDRQQQDKGSKGGGPAAPQAAAAEAAEPTPEKRIRNLKKRLVQINKLKEMARDQMTPEQIEKMSQEGVILEEIAALEKGEVWPPASAAAVTQPVAPTPVPEVAAAIPEAPAAPQAPSKPQEPMSAEEAKKRIKANQKKLKQIETLRQKGGQLSEEEKLKVAQEKALNDEIAQLTKAFP